TLLISVTPSGSGTITDTASVTANGGQVDLDPTNNTASADTAVSPADVGVTIQAQPATATAGQPLTFVVTVTNAGPAPAAGVTLTDNLPIGVTFVSATADNGTTPSFANGVVTADLGTLAANGSVTVRIVVTPLGSGTITDRAGVTSAQFDNN